MEGSIALSRSQRNNLMEFYRRGTGNPQLRLRAHILLLLADGRPWALIATMLYCSSATIARWKDRFERGGIDALLEEDRGRTVTLVGLAVLVIRWVKKRKPRDFGFFRSRWCCSTLVLLLFQTRGVKVSDETVRRWLHQSDLVWRRPRPTVKSNDPQKTWKLRKIREFLRDLPEDEAAFFQDEVDLNLNPEIGCMWMQKGEQAEILTPGNNVKQYLCGSMNWRNGQLISTLGPRRNADLFVRHLDDLRRRFRRYKCIHVICDNARFHTIKGSKVVKQYLAEHGDRIKLHYLPAYSPQHNPIERVWWHLREEVTRNHCCKTIEELVNLTIDWIEDRKAFKIQGRMYERLKRAA